MSSADPVAAMAATLRSTTGKSLDEWTAMAIRSGKERHGDLVAWLKCEHRLTYGYASLVAHADVRRRTSRSGGIVERHDDASCPN